MRKQSALKQIENLGRFAEIKNLSKQDRKDIFDFAMQESDKIVKNASKEF